MLKKLRWRFIGAAMGAFSAVILTLLLVINLWNYQSTMVQLDGILNRLQAVESGEKMQPSMTPPMDVQPPFSPEMQYMIRFFTVTYDSDGEVSGINQDFIASVSEEAATQYAEKVLSSGKSKGFLGGYRYQVSKTDSQTRIVFLNAEKETQMIRMLLVISAVIAACCLTVVFLLVLLLSRRAIKPFVRNMETQKQFVTNAGHELKTPLTAIATSADVLAMDDPDNEWVTSIQEQSAHLSKLISNLVTLSRLDEQNPFPEKQMFSISDAVWEAAEPFTALAKGQGKSFTMDIEGNVMFLGDQTAVQQMISILLDNAVKYAAEKGEIRLELRRKGRKVEICVSNSCAPDAEVDTARLFERFYRGNSSQTAKVGGSGIGLSIAKATAEAHGGSISVEKKQNTITFRIII